MQSNPQVEETDTTPAPKVRKSDPMVAARKAKAKKKKERERADRIAQRELKKASRGRGWHGNSKGHSQAASGPRGPRTHKSEVIHLGRKVYEDNNIQPARRKPSLAEVQKALRILERAGLL